MQQKQWAQDIYLKMIARNVMKLFSGTWQADVQFDKKFRVTFFHVRHEVNLANSYIILLSCWMLRGLSVNIIRLRSGDEKICVLSLLKVVYRVEEGIRVLLCYSESFPAIPQRSHRTRMSRHSTTLATNNSHDLISYCINYCKWKCQEISQVIF